MEKCVHRERSPDHTLRQPYEPLLQAGNGKEAVVWFPDQHSLGTEPLKYIPKSKFTDEISLTYVVPCENMKKLLLLPEL